MFKINVNEVYNKLSEEGKSTHSMEYLEWANAILLIVHNFEEILSKNIMNNNKDEDKEKLKDSEFINILLSNTENNIRKINEVKKIEPQQVFYIAQSSQDTFNTYLSLNKNSYTLEIKLSDFIKNCISRNILFHLYCNVFEQYEGVDEANKDPNRVKFGLYSINKISQLSTFIVENVKTNSSILNNEEKVILSGIDKILKDISQITHSLSSKNTLSRKDSNFNKLSQLVDEIYESCEINKTKEENIGKIRFKF